MTEAHETQAVTTFPAENIRDWRGHAVVDGAGDKIGSLEAIYVDTRSDGPAFATVEVGIVGRKRLVFVPLAGATVAPDYVRVRCDKKQVKGAPAIDTDGELLADDEPGLFSYYGLSYPGAETGQRALARR
jgi:hypothetical protein